MSSKRILWFLAAGALAALLLWRADEPAGPVTAPVSVAPPILPPPAVAVLPPLVVPAEPPPPAAVPARIAAAQVPASEPPRPLEPGVVPIRDQRTIDFSSGKAVVRNEAAEKAALEAALKEMEEATKGVTFGPNGGAAVAP